MSRSKSNKGFSLIEAVVVVVIVGILATAAFVKYMFVFEKARADIAKQALWEIKVAWGQYILNFRDQSVTFSDLNLDRKEFPHNCAQDNHFFRYDINSTHAIATRCTSGGKKPQGNQAYTVTLNLENSTWGGTPGYY
ncbi:MAG TPA: prepilin-type N-terminal cleavage/methylation domain-containing protein [Candidatus Omnitrophota bacterium]|mgnify:CR=1 FL=1|nr:prepilin-type N-terminal cleavage/methylation domain-containing protein [Candidatus Omnitrophota bacterium]HQJ16283.1 prepilin-type N-terminal cleavage/methylation domain-containing protein [Candidatus Omnitrophota bacterium]